MTPKVPFLDLRITEESERLDLLAAMDAVLRHGRLILGPEVAELESAIAERVGRKHAVGVGSGTDALFMALKSLGVGTGDEVITTCLSWIATANAIALTGATPIFADIGDDLNVDPAIVASLITPATKALMPVHYTGKLCRMPEIMALATENGLAVIEDAAQAFDAERQGRKAGSWGAMACFSMNAMKVFAACGEAGFVLCDEIDTRDKLISLRYNGTVNRETCIMPSLNFRLDTLQAAILLRRLARVDGVIERRRKIAAVYDELLCGVVDVPREEPGYRDVYYTYTIRAESRNELKAYLEARGIETKIQHPILMPDQPAYRSYVRNAVPNAQRLIQKVLCIPAHEKLSLDDVEYVADCIKEFYGKNAA